MRYADCCVGRTFTITKCKPQFRVLVRCMNAQVTPENVLRYRREIAKERIDDGTSMLRARERRFYNRTVLPDREIQERFLGKKVPLQIVK